MKKRRKKYWFLLGLTMLFVLAAITTFIPSTSASKTCMLGYKAHCPFTPLSTLTCIIAAGLIWRVRGK